MNLTVLPSLSLTSAKTCCLFFYFIESLVVTTVIRFPGRGGERGGRGILPPAPTLTWGAYVVVHLQRISFGIIIREPSIFEGAIYLCGVR